MSDERDIDTVRERVSSHDDDDDYDEKHEDAPRKLEPAPPPKENAWTNRAQLSSSSSTMVGVFFLWNISNFF